MEPAVKFVPAEQEQFRRSPRFSTYEWTCRNLRLVAGPYKGKLWRPDVAPYAKAIMDLVDRPNLRKLFILGPSQTTKTTIAYACMLAQMCRKLMSVGIGMPIDKTAKRIFAEKLTPYVRQVPALRKLLASSRYATTETEITFADDSKIYGMWSGSEAAMSSISMEWVLIDEEDAYTDKGAIASMEERCTAYEHLGTSKVIRFSKPRGTESESTIWRDLQREAQVVFQWEARCPDCGTYQVMDDSRIKAVNGSHDPREILEQNLARYECIQCGFLWTEETRRLALRNGRMHPDPSTVNPTVAGVHVRAWEAPLISLSKILSQWFAAQGDPRKLKAYDNNIKTVPYRVITRETPEQILRERITKPEEHRRQTVPPEAWALTCGIDMQMTGFWFTVRAWSRSMESWLVDWGWLNGWDDVEQLLETTYPVQGMDGVRAPIWRAGIDTGGGKDESAGWSKTDEAYGWIQQNALRYRNIYGCKGSSRPMQMNVRPSQIKLDRVPQRYGNLQRRMTIYFLDTLALKDLVHYRLNQDSKQPMWLHAQTEPGELEPYIRQMVAERKQVDKEGKETWDAGGRANHLFDCEVIAHACADPVWHPPLLFLPRPFRHEPRPERPAHKPDQNHAPKISLW